QYNLLMREEEREMLPFCLDQGVGVIPWSPLARGYVTRPWGTATHRTQNDQFGSDLYQQQVGADKSIIDAVASIAKVRGVTMAQVALAWVSSNPAVTAPIVGVTKQQHLTDAIASLKITLTAEELDLLESPYVPQTPEGF
ncbi:MAG: aldo/keto reductase, partial [Propionibacteriaceae bacterium]|nr:aldo/keto reductase [Propionibacteriaceae bacterium]